MPGISCGEGNGFAPSNCEFDTSKSEFAPSNCEFDTSKSEFVPSNREFVLS